MATVPATTTAQQKAAAPKDKRIAIRSLFESQRPELTKLLPKGMDMDRLFRMALTEVLKKPQLLDCSAESWALALQTCGQQGLYPDSGLGYMYLIPRNNSYKINGQWVKRLEVQAQRGYQGDIKLARNTGELADIYAEVVYAKDKYKVTKGLNRDIVHEPYDGDDEPGALRACYAVAKLVSGEVAFVTLTKRDVMRHKESSKNTSDDSPWKTHEDAMWRKTAIHELYKWLPKATEKAEAFARELTGDKPIDVTAIAASTVPVQQLSGLEGLTAQLGEAAPESIEAGEKAPENCKHPSVPPSMLAGGKTAVCKECGKELRDPDAQPDRVVGEDDGPETDPKAAVQALAAAAEKKPLKE